MNYTIEAHKDGKLYVVGEWSPDSTFPRMERCWWPTGLSANEYPELVSRRAEAMAPGLYRVVTEMGDIRFVHLLNGATTVNAYYEQQAIGKPKWAKAWKYGRWVR